MSTLSARAESLRLFLRAYKPVVVLLLAVLGGVIGGLLATSPLLALASIVLLVVSITVLSWPEAATLLVIFILYSNIAVVLVRFHGVPFIAEFTFDEYGHEDDGLNTNGGLMLSFSALG